MVIIFHAYFDICVCVFLFTSKTSKSGELANIEVEYIRNLQQQIYFLELEANYLYPLF